MGAAPTRGGEGMNRLQAGTLTLVALAAGTTALAQLPPRGIPQPDITLDAGEKRQTITSLERAIQDSYVFPDVADRIVRMLKDRQAHGAYDKVSSAKEFSDVITGHLADIAHDRHLHLIYSAKALPPMDEPKPGESPLAPDARMLEQMQREQRHNNFGFERVERLPGNIGYLKLDGFSDAALGGDRIEGAMAFLADTDALIIDLRDNHGGNPGMVQLIASYFFPGEIPVHLNDLAWRQMGTRSEELTQWWTLPYVPGKRYVGKDVYILTSQRTFSAAEEFTYDMQAQKRATIVGETTGGGANPGGVRRLSDHFAAFVPTGHAINPVTKTNWEGKGITPDVQVPKDDALKSAQRAALQRLLEKTRDEHEAGELKQALEKLQ
jgi:retinol-binding protein 3